MASILGSVADSTLGNVNITLVAMLLVIGWLLKHVCTFLDNKYIPIIITVLALVIVIASSIPFDITTDLLPILMQGLASGAIAVIAHEKGKGVLEDLFSNNSTEEVYIEESTEEEESEE